MCSLLESEYEPAISGAHTLHEGYDVWNQQSGDRLFNHVLQEQPRDVHVNRSIYNHLACYAPDCKDLPR